MKTSQIRQHRNLRRIGDWPQKMSGRIFSSFDGSFFVPTKIMISLSRVAERYRLPGFAETRQHYDRLVDAYLADAEATQEPTGTVAFWPLRTFPDNTQRRSHWHNVLESDLCNDFDDSALLISYEALKRKKSALLPAFAQTVHQWVDRNRPHQSAEEDTWKRPNSGAFLTWAEPRTAERSRIANGRPNDVDCVVNLNVLGALAQVQEAGHHLPPATVRALADTRKLLSRVVSEHLYPRCSLYYLSEAHFFVAAARALGNGAEPFDTHTRRQLPTLAHRHAIALLDGPSPPSELHGIAEMLLSLKLLTKPDARDSTLRRTLHEMRARLHDGLQRGPDGLHLPPGPLFRGLATVGMRGEFFTTTSRAQSTALALEALTEP